MLKIKDIFFQCPPDSQGCLILCFWYPNSPNLFQIRCSLTGTHRLGARISLSFSLGSIKVLNNPVRRWVQKRMLSINSLTHLHKHGNNCWPTNQSNRHFDKFRCFDTNQYILRICSRSISLISNLNIFYVEWMEGDEILYTFHCFGAKMKMKIGIQRRKCSFER